MKNTLLGGRWTVDGERAFSQTILAIFISLSFFAPVFSQKIKKAPVAPAQSQIPIPQSPTAPRFDEKLYGSIQWRNVGPYRGGRSAAVTGVAGKPNLFYFGGTGGGVWRTQDGGRTWENISDGFFGGSIGAIEVAPSDNNVIYVGGGEVTVRGNVSSGSGLWKSEDAGKTWKSIGLRNSRHVPRIRVHPANHDLVYAAVLGDLFKTSDERGVYRSRDGGKTWERVLYVNGDVGAVDLCMDPVNPRILYASTWRIRRSPYSLSSGGPGSALWKSTDGGDTWTELTKNPSESGLPKDTLGIIGVTVSPVNHDRVWAIIESQTGGVFRSDDAGKTWKKLNDDRNMRQRAWYYTRIYADTKDPDIVYVVNVAYFKSKDGGKTFSSKYAPHGDHHDLWIAPDDNRRLVIGDDGGGQVSYDAGETWSTYHNQPTAQFYRVATDNAWPYRIYAAQQDNSSVRIVHRSDGFSITEKDWESTAGGESAHIAPDPSDPDIVYGGEYHGFFTRVDHKRKTYRAINIWPEDNMGHGAEDARYRFQWNFPIFFSPHNPKKIYACSNHLHTSTNEGQSWEVISPDLTTNDKSRQKSSGGPITQDNTGVEYYCTIFAAAESPRVRDLIWTGSDDGLIHLTRDAGKNWRNVTPADLPKWTMINCVEPDPFHDGGCYVAATSYKNGDYAPYLYRTKDYGATWEKIVSGIDSEHFTRVVRADPKRAGLLYAGTESGMYVSFDDGGSWQKFQLNLPIVPVTDLAIKEGNLIAATQGRSLWILDDLAPLHQLSDEIAKKEVHFYAPSASYRMRGGSFSGSKTTGENRANGAFLHFFLKNKPGEKDTVKLEILESGGKTIRTFSNKDDKNKLEAKDGGNLFVWNMRYPDAKKFEGMILWGYDLEGPKAVPGNYRARLTAFGQKQEVGFEILADKRSPATPEDFKKQFEFVTAVGDKISEMHQAITDIREIRSQFTALTGRWPDDKSLKPLRDRAKLIDSTMTKVEEALYQTKNRSNQDPLNFPVRLNDKLANLMGINVGDDWPPTNQSVEVKNYLLDLADIELAKWRVIKEKDLPDFNRMLRESGVDLVRLKERKE